MNSDVAIEIKDLTKIYKIFDRNIDRLKEVFHPLGKKYHAEFFALNGVNLSVPRGKCVGIIGLNGSGKSTLLQCIAGVLTPSKGTISVNGKIAALLELGAGFNPEFTGIENVRFQCAIMGLEPHDIDRILPDIQAFADIGEFVNHPVKTYSSGMYVRLAFSVAIHTNPDILIVDEALAVGDIRFQAKCLAKIRDFRAQGKTLLFVSHDAGAVKSLCDEAILLDRGRVIAAGSPSDIFNSYNSLIAERDHRESNASQSLHQKAKRSGSQRVQIEQVRVIRGDGAATDTFTSGERIHVEMTVRANQPTSNVSVGFLIRDRLGNDIYGVNTYLLGHSLEFTASSPVKNLRFAMPAALGENIYTVTVAAHTGDNHVEENFDWHNDVTVFRVIHRPGAKFAGSADLRADLEITP